MRIRAQLVALALTAVAAGCVGSSSASHSPLTGAQALGRARSDGFTGATETAGTGSWRCTAHTLQLGPPKPTGKFAAYQRPRYALEFGDRRAPPTSNDTGRIAMGVYVFGNAALPARCLRGGMYSDEHRATPSGYRVVAPGTIEMAMHKPGAPGTMAGTDGVYDIYLARGDVLALGLAYNRRDTQIVRADLARISQQISG
jgi:hypothetical protein